MSGDEPARWVAIPIVLRFPRVSGDEPCLELQGDNTAEFSPRERG